MKVYRNFMIMVDMSNFILPQETLTDLWWDETEMQLCNLRSEFNLSEINTGLAVLRKVLQRTHRDWRRKQNRKQRQLNYKKREVRRQLLMKSRKFHTRKQRRIDKSIFTFEEEFRARNKLFAPLYMYGNLEEALSIQSNWIQQSVATDWMTTKITDMLSEKLMERLTSAWPDIIISACGITSITFTLLAIIMACVDLWQYGITTARILGLMSSLLAMTSQVALALGIVAFQQTIGGLVEMLTGTFETLSDSTIKSYVSYSSLPSDEQHAIMTDLFATKIPFSKLVKSTTAVVAALEDEVKQEQFYQTGCGPISSSLAECLAGITKLSQAAFSDPRYFGSDQDVLVHFAEEYGATIQYVSAERSFKVSPKISLHTVCISKTDNTYVEVPMFKKQASLPSLETFISLAVGFVALGLSICGMCELGWATTLNKNMIQATRLKKALREEIKDAKEMVETIAEEVFDYKMSPFAKLKEQILDNSNKLTEFLNHPHSYYASHPVEYYKFKQLCANVRQTLTTCKTTTGQLPQYITTATTILMGQLTRADQYFTELSRASIEGKRRQETLPIMVVGRYGAGKTHFLTHYAMPKIIKSFGWPDRVYSLNFGGQEYFPPYAGQEVCLYDEFLDVKEEDPIIPHINGICSGASYNMPGAELWTKVQPCLIKVMFLASNSHYVSLKNKLSATVEAAFYSRFKRYEFVNRGIPTTSDYDRNKIPRTPDYSEFEIRRYIKPATAKSAEPALSVTDPNVDTLSLADPYVIITKEEFVAEVCAAIQHFDDTYSGLTLMPTAIGNLVPPITPIVVPPKKVMFAEPEIPKASISRHNEQVEMLAKDLENSDLEQKQLEAFNKVVQDQFYNLDIPDDVKFGETGDLTVIINHLLQIDWSNTQLAITQEMFEILDYLLSKSGERALRTSKLPRDQVENLMVLFDMDAAEEDPETTTKQAYSDSKIDHFVCLLKGDTDSGKSTAARHLSVKLANVFKMPLVDITVETLREKSLTITQPSIVVLHDKMENEQAYINFYDSLPKPSLIINTNNLRISKTRKMVGYQVPEEENVAGTTIIGKTINRVIKKASNLLYYFQPVSVIQPHSASTVEPGFARRVGVTGYVTHAGQIHYRSEETTSYYHCLPYSRFVSPVSNKEIGETDLLQEIVQKYLAIHNKAGGILFEEVNDIPEKTADVSLHFESTQQLADYVNDPFKMLGLYAKSVRDPTIIPRVAVSEGVTRAKFIFTADMFKINDITSVESVKQMAERAYALLMKGNSAFTCYLDIGSEFKAWCDGNKIQYAAGGKLKEQFAMYNHLLAVVEHNGVKTHCVQINRYQNNENHVIASLNMDTVAEAIVKGIQSLQPDDQNLEVYEYLLSQRHVFESDKVLAPYFEKYKIREVFAQEVVNSAPLFYEMWSAFTESTVYKVVLTICAIVVTITGIFMIFGIGKLLYKLFVSTGETKDERTIYSDGIKATVKSKINGTVVNFEVISSQPLAEDTDDIICAIHRDEFKQYALGEVEYTVTQSMSTYDNQKSRVGKKGKGLPMKVIRRVATKEKQSISNSSTLAIQTKIFNNQVWVKGVRSDCYGLRWKDLDVLTPAHIWNNVGDLGYMTINKGDSKILCSAMVYWLDHVNDIAVLRISNKECPLATDLTKYFCTDSGFETIKDGAILSRAVVMEKRPTHFYESPQVITQGIMQAYIKRDNKLVEGVKRHVAFHRVGMELVSTAPGDCGSPYISLDNHLGHKILLGMHTNINRDGRSSFGCFISQEYLASVKPMKMEGQTQSGVDIATEGDAIEFDEHMKVYIENPNKFETGVKYGITPFYKEWFDALEEKEVENSDVWFDAEDFPDSNVTLIGYDPKHKPSHLGKASHEPTPWSDELAKEMPVTKWHSLYKYTQHSQPEILHKLGKKPSLLAEQISYYNDKCILTPEALELLEGAYESCLADYRAKYPHKLRILTDLETINGTCFTTRDPLYGCLEAMDFESSAGDYPMRRWGQTTKQKIFRKVDIRNPTGRDIYNWEITEMAQDIMEQVESYRLYAERGYRLLIPMKDALKFELVEKKDKARLFTVLSLEETMFGRKYTGALQASIMKEHAVAHTQVGINPVPGFHVLYQRLHAISRYGEAGDYKRWDKHMQAPLISKAFQLFAQLYKDSLEKEQHEVIDNVFRVMADSTINSLSIADGYVYMKHRGVPSGCPTTAILNSCINDLMQYMCLEYLCRQHNKMLKTVESLDQKSQDEHLLEIYGKEWHNYISKIRKPVIYSLNWVKETMDWATYGDDFVSSIHDNYLWLINFKSRQKFYGEVMGITYDDPTKDGKTFVYKEIHELMFLSRVFRQEAGLTFAALKKSSIESLLHYVRKNSMEQYKGNIKDCQDEAILWGKDYYEFIQRQIRKIIAWGSEHGIKLDVTLVPYKQQLQWAVDTIRYTKAVRILPKKPEQKDSIGSVKPDYTPTALQIVESDTIQQGETMQRETLLAKTHEALKRVTFDRAQNLISYHPYPAYIESYNVDDVVSVVFNAKRYINSLAVSGLVQSDIMKFVMPQIAHLGLTLGRVTIIHRKIGNELKTAYQVTFNYKVTKTMIDWLATSLSTIQIPKTTDSTQASGTEQRSKIQGGMNHAPDGEMKDQLNHGHKIPKSDISRVLWHQDLKSLAHTPMETPDSPLSIAISTPAHTVILKRTLTDISNMPPGMKAWASSHTYSNASRVISMKFISAATLINELVLGISPVSKTTYTIQELQLIHWTALNPQDVTATVTLDLADVAWTAGKTFEVNRYEFATSDTGTDTNPVNIPTLVLMTRVGIQNSYANPDVTVQIAIQEHFAGGTFLIDQDRLNSFLPKDPQGFRQIGSTLLSDWLNVDKGMPLYITCDGNVNVQQPVLNVIENLPKEDKIMQAMDCEFAVVRSRDGTSLDFALTPSQTVNKLIPILPNGDVEVEVDGERITYKSFEDWLNDKTQIADTELLRWIKNKRMMMPFINQAGDTKKFAVASPMSSPYVVMFFCINGKGHYTCPFEVTRRDVEYEYSAPSTVNFQNIVHNLAQKFTANLAQDDVANTNHTFSLIPNQLIELEVDCAVITSPDDFQEAPFKTYAGTVEAIGVESLPSETSTVRYQPEYAVMIDCITSTETFRVLCVIAKNHFIVEFSEALSSNKVTTISRPVVKYMQTIDSTRAIGSGMNSVSGTISSRIRLVSSPDVLAQVVFDVQRDGTGSLDANFTALSFPYLTPKTITSELAATRTPVEFGSEMFLKAFRRKLKTEGIILDDPSKVVVFNLSLVINVGISIIVVYNPYYNVFFINNAPQGDIDYYKTFRKLTYEDVVISQIRVVDKISAAVPLTNTSQWLSRIQTTESQVFTGRILTNSKNVRPTGNLRLSYVKRAVNSTQAMAGLATASLVTGIFTDIFGYMAKMQLMDKAMEIQLKLMEAQYQNQAELMDQEYSYKVEMLEKQIKAASVQQTNAIDQQNNLRLNLSGLQSGLRNRTSGTGESEPMDTSEPTPNLESSSMELDDEGLNEDPEPYIPPNRNSDSNYLIGNATSPAIAKNVNVNIPYNYDEQQQQSEPTINPVKSGAYKQDKLSNYLKSEMNPTIKLASQRPLFQKQLPKQDFVSGGIINVSDNNKPLVTSDMVQPTENLSSESGPFRDTIVVANGTPIGSLKKGFTRKDSLMRQYI